MMSNKIECQLEQFSDRVFSTQYVHFGKKKKKKKKIPKQEQTQINDCGL